MINGSEKRRKGSENRKNKQITWYYERKIVKLEYEYHIRCMRITGTTKQNKKKIRPEKETE